MVTPGECLQMRKTQASIYISCLSDVRSSRIIVSGFAVLSRFVAWQCFQNHFIFYFFKFFKIFPYLLRLSQFWWLHSCELIKLYLMTLSKSKILIIMIQGWWNIGSGSRLTSFTITIAHYFHVKILKFSPFLLTWVPHNFFSAVWPSIVVK